MCSCSFFLFFLITISIHIFCSCHPVVTIILPFTLEGDRWRVAGTFDTGTLQQELDRPSCKRSSLAHFSSFLYKTLSQKCLCSWLWLFALLYFVFFKHFSWKIAFWSLGFMFKAAGEDVFYGFIIPEIILLFLPLNNSVVHFSSIPLSFCYVNVYSSLRSVSISVILAHPRFSDFVCRNEEINSRYHVSTLKILCFDIIFNVIRLQIFQWLWNTITNE